MWKLITAAALALSMSLTACDHESTPATPTTTPSVGIGSGLGHNPVAQGGVAYDPTAPLFGNAADFPGSYVPGTNPLEVIAP